MYSTIENIKRLLTEYNMTQLDLAKKSGIAHETINKIVNGKYTPSAKLISKIAKALNVDIDYLTSTTKTDVHTDVQGYIEYSGEIIKVTSCKHLQKLMERIEYETKTLPKEVNEIRAINEQNRKAIKKSKTPYDFNLDFEVIQSHDATSLDCWAFKTSKDTKSGITLDLGNQCSGYPFTMNGHTFHTSESAYLCG